MPHKTIIWGTSGHALVVADILRLGQNFTVVGMIDDFNQNRYGTKIDGIPVLGGRECLDHSSGDLATHLIFGFGDCDARLNLAALIEAKGYAFASAIHPHATIARNANVGPGTVVVAGAIINPAARVGRNVIINTCASVDHECEIGDAVHIGPGARLGGLVTIEAAAWVGIGATVLDRVRIGAGSIIGAGSVITKDVPAGVVVYGVPGRIVRSVKEHVARTKQKEQRL